MLEFLFIAILSFSGYCHGCSWDKCPQYSDDPNVINVHLICHSHDDMGWLKTVDDYYTGRNKAIVNVAVEPIFNTVIDELDRDANKRFSFAEVGFLMRWLEGRSANDSRVQSLKKLVKDGQVELLGGGWVQSDEGAAHYIDIIGQYSLGVNKLLENFGKCAPPKIAWQIDPFGHSREHANIAALFGYEGLIHGRIHYEDVKERIANRSLDYVWVTSDDLKMELPTTAFYSNIYTPPANFCFDVRCWDEPIVDDEKLEGYNMPEKRDEFVEKMKTMAKSMRHNHVLVSLGGDFQYSDANVVFTSNDRLIRGVNAITNQTGVNVFYSTPSCYMRAISKGVRGFPKKHDDHFPYAIAEHAYWSGYFTSKPELKRMIRQLSNLLQLAKGVRVLANLTDHEFARSEEIADRALSLTQHHDAVTGTSKENVTADYERRIREAAEAAQKILSAASFKQLGIENSSALEFCSQFHHQTCSLLKNHSEAILTVFNGNSHSVKRTLSLSVHSTAKIYDENLEKVTSEFSKASYAENSPQNPAPYQLHFEADLPALGFKIFLVRNSSKDRRKSVLKSQTFSRPNESPTKANKEPLTLENSKIKLVFDEDGMPKQWTNKELEKSFQFRQEYRYYFGAGGEKNEQSSGAYIFRPNGTTTQGFGKPSRVEFVKGKNFQEVRQVFAPWVSQTIRLDQSSDYVEFKFLIGPIPKEAKNPVAKEVIGRFNVSEIQSVDTFYTDSNGRQMMERKINHSPTYKRDSTEPIASNFYPVASTILIRDKNHQLVVLTDRSQAGGSFGSGNIDLMVHRRCFHDDGFGVEEALDEPGKDGRGLVVGGSHFVKIGRASGDYRRKAEEIYNEPVVAFMPTSSAEFFTSNRLVPFHGLVAALPDQLKILTLKHLAHNRVLLRLENFYQLKEGKGNAQVGLNKLFTTMVVSKITEVSLLGHKTIGELSLEEVVELRPMEIRSFELTVERV